jgi:small subunit ribosomal protein S5
MPREPKKQEVEKEENIEKAEEIVEEKAKVMIPEGWEPKTILGKKVVSGEITDIAKVFSDGIKIAEPSIVDVLLPNLEREIILIGGSTGKGGGIRRTPFKRTSRMHKSGRRYRISVMVGVGNKNGYVGIGLASGPPGKHQEVIEKAMNKAKLKIIPVRRGCGSWECSCGTNHSIPFIVKGKSGSVVVELLPAPKGIGLCVSDEVKKLMRLAGISDIWCKTRGNTHMRINLIKSVFNALKKLNTYKIKPDFEKQVGMTIGKVE